MLKEKYITDGLSSLAYRLSSLVCGGGSNLIVVTPERKIAEILVSNLNFYLSSKQVAFFPDWEVLPFDTLSPPVENSIARLSTLYKLLHGESLLVVTTASALMQRIIAPAQLQVLTKKIQVGVEYDRKELLNLLERGGYHRTTLVEEPGDYAVRGAVIDLFSPVRTNPIRIEFFDDLLESIRVFDSESQRSLKTLASFEIVPVAELPFFYATNEALAKLKIRASELEIPYSSLELIEAAIVENSFCPGFEHLQGLLNPETGTFFDYVKSEIQWCIYDELSVYSSLSVFEHLIEERADRALRAGRVFPQVSSAFNSAKEVVAKLKDKLQYSFETIDLSVPGESNSPLREDEQCFALTREVFTSAFSTLPPAAAVSRRPSEREVNEKPFLPVVTAIRSWQQQGYLVAFVTSQKQRNRKVVELLAGYDIPSQELEGVSFQDWFKLISEHQCSGQTSKTVYILSGILSTGLIVPEYKFVLIYEADVFPDLIVRRKTTGKSLRKFLGALTQLQDGDFIVHNDYGVACYHGLVEVLVDGNLGDFLQLEYADGAKLYLPVENIGKIQKYIGVEGRKPVLSKLGTNAWAKTKQKVKQQVIELAGQLINLYAQREIMSGIAYTALDEQDQAFADSFGFEETPDQAQAIEEVLKDMVSSKPMDRLVCGDVGYGKTEVGMRAAFKAVTCGKQVAILVPTTVLAEQHYKNFKERMEDFGIIVGVVSRFSTVQENKETLQKLAQGKIDIIIGTHRLIQKDVSFKNLGLLIIDEEHRFGVAHKEKLKQFRKEVDVLTLTATPIPRTLNMSLMGIRDLSVIETPPCDRQVIQTYISQYEDSTVREAILRELGRGGQVFYIHNRVQTIAGIAQEVAALVPEARVEFAHGQMQDGQLSKIMHRFLNKEIDVLVSTTIVESGIDIANANTIIIRKAESFGLAELYQLRGRVGRSSRRAYAYLFIGNMNSLGAEARQRLKVLQSLDDLGVGFRLALQDMEIRGAGNLLGKDQSGEVNAVGFDLYSKILKDAVREIQRRERQAEAGSVESAAKISEVVDPELKIGFPIHIPADYIQDVSDRLLLYQRLVELENKQAGYDILEEIEDRFGTVPKEVESLIEIMIFRSLLKQTGIVSVMYKNNKLSFSFHPQAEFDRQKLVQKALEAGKVKQKADLGVAGTITISPAMVITLNLNEHAVETPIDLYNCLLKLLPELGVSLSQRVGGRVATDVSSEGFGSFKCRG
ncbi:MAG: transcription-repair coupling factor [Deltaproteobacteria bacterium]|jgi:transcription-repair coupling factor (superfamily II helicase)|nr:transcription-repair coupling factor [Deltaproteobacteria bacterium]